MNSDPFDNDEDDLGLDDTGFDEFDSGNNKGNTLGDLWRSNPLFKIGTVVGGVALLAFAVIMLGGNEEAINQSRLPSGPDVAATPGEEGAPQAYVEAVVDENTERFEEALSSGGSAIPTPIDSRRAILSLGEEVDEGGEDPLDRWRRLQQERAQMQATQPDAPAQPDPEAVARRAESIQALADLMAEQMGTILETHSQVEVNSQSFTDPSFLQEMADAKKAEAEAAAGVDRSDDDALVTILPAGEIEYAQLITQANSDVPGPVLAQIAGGPLSGARVLGSFSVVKEMLTLKFDKIVIDDVTYPINAVALDPATTLPGMATDVDHHYFMRVVLPAAAAFVEGFAGAISESGRTSIIVEGDTVTSSEEDASNDQEVASGVEELGEELGEILDDMADDIETTVIVAQGTPMGLLFLEPVQVPESAYK
jgi:intracellular multiplication protein IcmE